nr:hypothetical protein [Synechococcus sp. Minos11]
MALNPNAEDELLLADAEAPAAVVLLSCALVLAPIAVEYFAAAVEFDPIAVAANSVVLLEVAALA